MSNRRVLLSPEAQRDYREILKYGTREWGVEEGREYIQRVDEALNRLTEFPGLGSAHFSEQPNLRAIVVSSHTIYYRYNDMNISVVRILHQRMNPGDHL